MELLLVQTPILNQELNHEDGFQGLFIAFLADSLLRGRFVSLKRLVAEVGIAFTAVQLAELI
jgi:hypothetical protein